MVQASGRMGWWGRWAMVVMIVVYAFAASVPSHAHDHADACGGHGIAVGLTVDGAKGGPDEPQPAPALPGQCCILHAGAITPAMPVLTAANVVVHVDRPVLRDDQIADFGAHTRLERPPRPLSST